ncbi:MAG: hypothetical protein FJ137_14450 [Deltaproteobacteria bacterium]|nr:hypothetical protein [Deltaproteobacteria bacterium]
MSNIPVTGPGTRGSITLDSGSSSVRQSPRTDFGTQVRNGIAAGGGAAGQAIGVAAPFVPGAAVVSAAVTGAAGGVGGQGGFGGQAGGGLGGVPGATSAGADGIPLGGSFLNAQQGGGSTGGAAPGSQQDLLNQTKGMQEMAQSFNLQYLQLQEKMQSENRSFSTVSNVMKTKHDTAKSSISNVR